MKKKFDFEEILINLCGVCLILGTIIALVVVIVLYVELLWDLI